MLQINITLLILSISIFMIFLKHPLAIGGSLLILTLLVALMSGMFYTSFWFSYILFLIFVGGMLILFIYTASLASNELFKMNLVFPILMLILTMFWILINLFSDNSLMMMMMNFDMSSLLTLLESSKEISINLNKLYNFPSNYVTLMLINYLFFTLVVIVKLTNFFFGPLRSFK